MSVRDPIVAGMFYPEGGDELKRAIGRAYERRLSPGAYNLPLFYAAGDKTDSIKLIDPVGSKVIPSRCVICPHAGYEYSAHVACSSVVSLTDNMPKGPIIIIGPEHAGAGSGASVSAAESWRTPLGDAAVDRSAGEALAGISDVIRVDDAAHAVEHSIEVEVPLLQEAFGEKLRIVPVALSDQDEATAVDVGRAAARVAADTDGAVVASSDLTHYEPEESAREKDAALLECVERLDVGAMYDTLKRRQISACGYGAIAAAMTAARELGAKKGRTIMYATSGDAKDASKDSVVGYASVVFS